jgi:dihydrofolate reductase
MRKVILGAAISLDGYIARANGAVDFLVMSEGASKALAEFFSSIDTLVMGRKTAPATGGSSSFPIQMPAYVFSRSQPAGERDGLTFVNESPEAQSRDCAGSPGRTFSLWAAASLHANSSRRT